VAGVTDTGWSPAATRDRLASTLFLAALFHGILILGVTFSAVPALRTPEATSLEVVILTRDYEQRAAPLAPALLAEQNLLGRGNVALQSRLRTALPAAAHAAAIGPEQAGLDLEASTSGSRQPSQAHLTVTAREHPASVTRELGAPAAPAAQQPLWRTQAASTELLTEPDSVTEVPDASPRELLVSASTRESRIAGYLNNWKSRVERIGTLNFPRAAEFAAMDGHPVLEVAIAADGSLREVVVRNSSGYQSLDQAAMEILRIAAPFEPFPHKLRQDYDVLRFAYEWHFGQGSRVSGVSGS
jgi:protein TonB